ncbi:MAG: hypothetical protein K6F05_04505 [Succinivibrio sp.]|nr:hypothetical protein [Succinivibrio sp.]
MQWHGLTRIPFYPELEVLRRTPADRLPQVLSLLLYWYSLPEHQDFNLRKHTHQISRSLRIAPQEVEECLDYLQELGIVTAKEHSFKTQSLNHDKQVKTDIILSFNFRALSERLTAYDLPVPVRVLKQASADHLDFYTYLSEERLPLVQGLSGRLTGEKYEQTCQTIGTLLVRLCADPELEDFARMAISPAWLMLCQPPQSGEDLARRWLRREERAIDLDLTDGAFFLPDADSFGTQLPHLWHRGKRQEPRVLAAALYLCPTSFSEEVHFISDLPLEVIEQALKLLYKFTGRLGRLDEAYFAQRELEAKERAVQTARYLEHRSKLAAQSLS